MKKIKIIIFSLYTTRGKYLFIYSLQQKYILFVCFAFTLSYNIMYVLVYFRKIVGKYIYCCCLFSQIEKKYINETTKVIDIGKYNVVYLYIKMCIPLESHH